jgi:hypothetical protein
MSNKFKPNSRFSSLIEENKRDEKNNLLKNENRYNKRQNDVQIRKYREIEEKTIKGLGEKKTDQIISINDFPELISKNNKKTSSNQMNFLNLIKNVETKCKEEKIINETKLNKEYNPKSTLLKKDLKHKPTYKENEIAYEVIKKLAELYEKRSNEYIELWGYDEWERMFIFSNYDYEYFDKLDRKYAEEMEEMEEMEYTDSNED